MWWLRWHIQHSKLSSTKQPSQIKQLVRGDHLLGHCSTGVLPRKYDIANSGSVAVDAYEAEGEGDLGHPRAPSLNQEVSKDQAEDSEQGEDGPVLGAGKKTKKNSWQCTSWWFISLDCSLTQFTRTNKESFEV